MTEVQAAVQEGDAPQLPLFEQMPLSDAVKKALAEMGYTQPAPVQHAVYELAVRGQDLVVQARTGTGKTAAFGIPLIDQIVQRSQKTPQALVLTPTRELALQIARELEQIAAHRELSVVSVYGGAPIQRQIDAIRRGGQIIIGTPGRVLDHMRRGTLDASTIRALVLDESDEMLSMGFERELNAILGHLPSQRQTMLFSATLPPDIVRIATDRLRDPEFVCLSGDQVGALELLHFVYFVLRDKMDTFLRMLETEDPDSALVFCNTKDETERVATALRRSGYAADWINGDLPQSEREQVMLRSLEGKTRFLVATDVAARGIDISHLTHVINYDFPDSAETYVHRTGRTGRMGKHGTAISLITPSDVGSLYYLRLTYKIRPFEKQLPTPAELKTRAELDLIQMLADTFATNHPDDLSLARRLLTHDRADAVIAGLLRSHLGTRMPAQQQEATEARRARLPRPAAPSQPPKHVPAAPKAAPDPVPSALPAQAELEPAPATKPVAETKEFVEDDAPKLRRRRTQERAPRYEAEPDAASPQDGSRRSDDYALPSYEATPLTAADLEEARLEAQRKRATLEPSTLDVTSDDDDSSEGEAPVSAPGTDEGYSELFVNVGRREGIRAGDLVRVITDGAPFTSDAIGRIRVRDRNSFVQIKTEHVQAALEMIQGRSLGNRSLRAELARPREAFADSPQDAS